MVDIQITINTGDIDKNPVKALQKFDRELSRYLERDLSKELESEFKKTIQGWKKPPEFRSKYYETDVQGRKVLTVGPFGRGRSKWDWVSSGTRRRTISAKKPNGMMKFPRNYTSKTTPSGKYGGPGRRHGPTVLAKRVSHQITARRFSEKIKDKQAPKIEKKVNQLARRSFK